MRGNSFGILLCVVHGLCTGHSLITVHFVVRAGIVNEQIVQPVYIQLLNCEQASDRKFGIGVDIYCLLSDLGTKVHPLPHARPHDLELDLLLRS